MAARSSSVSSFQGSCWCGLEVKGCCIISSVVDRVDITSEGLAFAFVPSVKIAANASSVTTRGKFLVRDMGR